MFTWICKEITSRQDSIIALGMKVYLDKKWQVKNMLPLLCNISCDFYVSKVGYIQVLSPIETFSFAVQESFLLQVIKNLGIKYYGIDSKGKKYLSLND